MTFRLRRRSLIFRLPTVCLLAAWAALSGCGGETPSDAGGRAVMRASEAEAMEKKKMWRGATDAWADVGGDPAATAEQRTRAWLRAADLRAERLKDPAGAAAALERALFLEPDATKRDEIRPRIEKYNQLLAASSSAGAGAGGAGSPLAPDRSPPGGAKTIATVGGDSISLEELLYVWKRDHPEEDLAPEKMNDFTQEYMTTLLLAEGARAQKLQDTTTFRLEMRHYERYLLNKSILATLVPQVSEEEALEYYEKNTNQFLEPPKVMASHIVVRERAEAGTVGERLRAGEEFDAVAADASLDRDTLPEGSRVGWLTEEEGFIPSVGWAPGVARWLVHAEEGHTTGPIETSRGFHWLETTEKKQAAPFPFEKVKENIREGLRRGTYAANKKDLLAKLKKDIPVNIDQAALNEGFRELQKQRPSRPAKSGAPPASAGEPHDHSHPHPGSAP